MHLRLPIRPNSSIDLLLSGPAWLSFGIDTGFFAREGNGTMHAISARNVKEGWLGKGGDHQLGEGGGGGGTGSWGS